MNRKKKKRFRCVFSQIVFILSRIKERERERESDDDDSDDGFDVHVVDFFGGETTTTTGKSSFGKNNF